MIEISNLSARSGAFRLEGVSLSVPAGEHAALMGKTGCGKTTLLEAVCGLRRVTAGTVRLGGRDVTALKPAERGIGYVPQDRALFPTMTVRGHLSFALEIRKEESAKVKARVEELAELLGIEGLLDRRPPGLSGGEAQRVALGRALSFRPEVLILDEPLAALDDETRAEVGNLIQSVRKKTGVTALHVTHSLEEARRLADRILVLEGGAVREAAPAGGRP